MDESAAIEAYLSDLFAVEDDVLKWVQFEADAHGLPQISITASEGRLLQMLMYLCNARSVVEIGTLAGYSGVWMARALPEDGILYTVEKSSKHAAIARRTFEKAGVSDKVRVMQGDAPDMLNKLSASAPFDMVFIDADKPSYISYLEWAIKHVRIGGIVTFHNALWHHSVHNPHDESGRLVDEANQLIAHDPRLESMVIGIGDGTAVGIRRK